ISQRDYLVRIIIGVMVAFAVLPTRLMADDAVVLKFVEKLGGSVTCDEDQLDKPIIEVDLRDTRVSDSDLQQLKDLRQLRSLNLMKTEVTDAGMKEVKELAELTSLNLRATKVTDAGIKSLASLKNLEWLSFRDTRVTDAG